MLKVKNILFVIAFQFLFVTVFSQKSYKEITLPQYIDYVGATASGTTTMNLYVPHPEAPYLKTKGDPYLYKSFIDGQMLVDDSILVKDLLLRYNIYTDEMQYNTDKGTFAIVTPERVNYFKFNGKKMVYAKVMENNTLGNCYFEVLTEGKCTLYRRYTCKLVEGNYNQAMSAGDMAMKIEKFDNYYISKDQSFANKIKPKKSKLLNVMKEDKPKLETYIKQNKLKLKKEKDLIKLIEYYNSIM